jgi:hypothetical protein
MRTAAALLFGLLAFACSPKKQETATTPVDTVGVDTVLATTPAAPLLAFDALSGFTVRKGFETPDSVNYQIISSQEALNLAFTQDKNTPAPDFIINYVLAVACNPTPRATTITLEKVETGENSINVFLNITRGAPIPRDASSGQATGVVATPSAIFAIERREGYPVMQFFVNGKKDKSLVLVM